MTFGVPYSFVPGTKAKADEVNANFVDVLTKIEDTNTRIDDANSLAASRNEEIADKFTQVEESIGNCSNLDLSNLSTAGQSKFDAKANASDIDGNWVWSNCSLASSLTLSNTNSVNFSLSNYLPNDGKIYEVLFELYGETTGLAFYIMNTGFSGGFYCLRAKGHHFANVFPVTVSSSRNVTIKPATGCSGSTIFILTARAYRKVR